MTSLTPSLRSTNQRIDAYLQERPALRPRYEQARAIRRILRKSNNYDLTSRCNLFCEGCFYFEGDDYKRAAEDMDDAHWDSFFAAQAAAGVSFGFFAGAEPGLAQERLLRAAQHIPLGAIHTNGTLRIRADIPYSIQISVWGDEDTTARFRGGNVFWKSIRNFANDPRVCFVFTINPNNLAQLPGVVRILKDYGHRIMFNYFSPTQSYLDKLARGAGNDQGYFRISSSESNMLFDADSLLRARSVVNELIGQYPGTVLQSRAFNDAVTAPGPLYALDANGIARNCNGRNFAWHQGYRVDMQPSDAKCCMPNVDCAQCRLYTIAIASFIFQPERFLQSADTFEGWLSICEQFARVYLGGQHAAGVSVPAMVTAPRATESVTS